MANMALTSNISFLYYKDMEAAKRFFGESLGLEMVYNPGWSCVYRIMDKSFIGCVDVSAGSIPVTEKGGFLISLTVSNLEEMYEHIKGAFGVSDLSEVKKVNGIPLMSFFFSGPEGYKFEIQQFTDPQLVELF